MAQYGIDWDKVDAKNNARLDALRPKVTAVTEEGAGRATSTRAKREAAPDTVVKSTRRRAAAPKPEVVEPGEDDLDTVPENADGDKV